MEEPIDNIFREILDSRCANHTVTLVVNIECNSHKIVSLDAKSGESTTSTELWTYQNWLEQISSTKMCIVQRFLRNAALRKVLRVQLISIRNKTKDKTRKTTDS